MGEEGIRIQCQSKGQNGKVQDPRERPCRVGRFHWFPLKAFTEFSSCPDQEVKRPCRKPQSRREKFLLQSRGVNQIKFGI